MNRVSLVVAGAATVVAALAGGVASASGGVVDAGRCHVSGAKVRHGALQPFTGAKAHPYGKALHAGQRLRSSALYRAAHKTEISWFQSTVSVSKGTQVTTGCYGYAVGQPANKPDLSIMMGTATVHDQGQRPLGIVTPAALVTPYEGEMSAHPKVGYVVREHHSARQFPTVTLHTLKGTPSINVTPYAGPQPGSCRHAKWAKLVYNPNTGGTAHDRLGP